MSFQTVDLAMSGLGIVGDSPPTDLQPRLEDGIHLRWGFRHERGFPWHGYYLFRRPHRPAKPDCLDAKDFREVLAESDGSSATTRLGVLRSDAGLALDSVAGNLGVDLSRGTFVRLDLAAPPRTYRVDLQIAFREAAKLRCRALNAGVVVAEAIANGSAEEIVKVTLEADQILAIEIQAGRAVLLELCISAIDLRVSGEWQAIPGFQYPLCLPVAHADYPCPSKPATPSAAQALALGRISYGGPDPWEPEFPSVHETLQELVAGGPPPSGEAMHTRSKEVLISGGTDRAPLRHQQRPLEMVLLPTVHPAFAQMLGLYFLDDSTPEGEAFDYLILADHTGVVGGTAGSGLTWLANPDFQEVDGWLCSNRKRAPAPPLEPPADVRAFSLPGMSSGGEAEDDARTHVGLRWDLRRSDAGALNAESAVLYHVWRVGFGPDEPTAPAEDDKYQGITAEAPVLVTLPGGPPGAQPERSSLWPPFRMYKVDRRLSEGWHNHRISGIDLFGRHSTLSPPARWFQWQPEPEPSPWYYEQPPGTRAIHNFAIRTLDKMPPPPPTGVEASALDPEDPMVVRDGVYDDWQADLSDAERADLVGLRIRWRWPQSHQEQAPRTREFRIYLNAGGDLPPDHALPPNWEVRRFVVGFDEHVTETPEGREYELIVPTADDTQRTGFEAVPTIADPVLYAHVAVTAADDREHTEDHPKWAASPWGGRHGNEGVVHAPAKVFRVLRTPPPPPIPVPAPAPRVFASRADFHGTSFFTYRFRPVPDLTLHVYRAVDGSVFEVDWARRPRPPLSVDDDTLFPDAAENPRWGAPLRASVIQELDPLNAVAPGLADRATAMERYRALSDDALRVLAGLDGNDEAFTQRTVQPLDPEELDPDDASLLRHRDRLGPDTADDYVPQAGLRAFLDELDGASTSRYFYRSAAVDGAHNQSALGLSSPPVYLPDVVPPSTPRGVVIRGEDRAISLRWQSNREIDLAEYRVYRTDRPERARERAKMQLVQTLGEDRPPPARPSHVTWIDTGAVPLKTHHYQVVAVDAAGQESPAGRSFAARAYDDARPAPPQWNPVVPAADTNAVTLTWTSADLELRCLVQRHAEVIGWEAVSGWLPRGVFVFEDTDREPETVYRYRLRVMDTGGRLNRDHNELTV